MHKISKSKQKLFLFPPIYHAGPVKLNSNSSKTLSKALFFLSTVTAKDKCFRFYDIVQ